MTERGHRAHQACRYLGAAALLGVGIDHIQQYFGASYSAIPTIGTLFALNFVSAVLSGSRPGCAARASLPASRQADPRRPGRVGDRRGHGVVARAAGQRADRALRLQGVRLPAGDRHLDRARGGDHAAARRVPRRARPLDLDTAPRAAPRDAVTRRPATGASIRSPATAPRVGAVAAFVPPRRGRPALYATLHRTTLRS